MSSLLKISEKLKEWYFFNKRDLPWRETKDPYRIWISEIILQQTRVAQGYDYYQRFVQTFPNIESLALADEHDVLLLWQGLGYYSRARNLHHAAKTIYDQHRGIFPSAYADIINLKGVGEYTAAAIASFAYSQPYAVVDGNVFRFLSRLFGIDTPINTPKGKKEFTQLANELLDKEDPALYNQAIMEFGALQCIPDNPQCNNCVFSENCVAYNLGNVKKFPVKEGKTKTRDRFFYYLDIRQTATPHIIYLNKRTQKDIWQNLYELPLIETDKAMSLAELEQTDFFKNYLKNFSSLKIKPTIITFKHILSHQKIYASFYQIEVVEIDKLAKAYLPVVDSDIMKYPISRLVDRYFEQLNSDKLKNQNMIDFDF